MSVLYLLAVILGVAVCLQGTANGLLSGRLGLPLTLSINSGIVFAGSLTWLCLARASAMPGERPSIPWLYFSGGLSGLAIISCAAVAYPKLGASTTTVLAVASQIATALLLDRFGLTGQRFPLNAPRVLGLVLVAGGVALALGAGDRLTR
ncbi:MAG TPA: DMT family transporter, partial [Planctomycetota bacterium]|nr:DMT family transporter [Planctomycetota bacterium]